MMAIEAPCQIAPQGADRRDFLRRAACMGVGLTLAGASPLTARAASHDSCQESVHDVIGILLTVERLLMTYYYAGLTTRSITRRGGVAGATPEKIGYLRSTLTQEYQHVRLLENLGAASSNRRFYFPAASFRRLGGTSHTGTYLWGLDHLETAVAGMYIAALKRFTELGRPDLAVLAARILGVECQHRAIYRALSQDDPADNITMAVAQFPCVRDASQSVQSFLNGRGFHPRPIRVVTRPTPAQLARVIGH